jgi:hypothetical protein
MFGSPVHWQSFRQSPVSKDTRVAEYYAASSVCDAIVFFHTRWNDFGYNLDVPIPLFVDNQPTRDIMYKFRVSYRGKYAEIQVHYVRDQVGRGQVSPCWVATNRILADVFYESLASIYAFRHV